MGDASNVHFQSKSRRRTSTPQFLFPGEKAAQPEILILTDRVFSEKQLNPVIRVVWDTCDGESIGGFTVIQSYSIFTSTKSTVVSLIDSNLLVHV